MQQATDEVAELRDWIVRVEGAVRDCKRWKANPPGGSTQQWRQDNELELIKWTRELATAKDKYHQLTGRYYPQ